jgi:class 3 adenylate cyclase
MPEYNEPSGHPMDEIARRFKTSPPSTPDRPASSAVSRSDQAAPADATGPEIKLDPATGPVLGPLSLAADQIAAPAFFVDRQLSLVWLAPDGTDPFSQALAREWEAASTDNIFNLLLRPAVKATISDWQAFFSFVYILLRRSTSREVFDSGTGFVSPDLTPDPGSQPSRPQTRHPFEVDSCLIGANEATAHQPLQIFGLGFDGGTLFLVRRAHRYAAAAGDRVTLAPVGSGDAVVSKTTVCMLSARLNESHRIADTMLPDYFFKLMNQIREAADDVARALGGTRTAGSGAGIQYVFTESAGRNPIFSAICCATRLNPQMQSLQAALTAKQGWTDDICLNMGISHGTDEATTREPAGSMEIMIPGGASDQAALLSAIAEKGEIWITRQAVGQLPKKQIDQVVLGVDRQGQFLRNFFIRLSDLGRDTGTSHQKVDLNTLSIARIVDMARQGPDKPITREV